MMRFIRYALATFLFAASVCCLALWWRSFTYHDEVYGDSPIGSKVIYISAFRGAGCIGMPQSPEVPKRWIHSPTLIAGMNIPEDARIGPEQFGWSGGSGVYFPLWYPALIFALAGVAALRIGRFTIRWALIATTVVALLLGMLVAL